MKLRKNSFLLCLFIAFLIFLFILVLIIYKESAMPITYQIGWWPSQNTLSVNILKVNIIKSELNLRNSKSLVEFRIIGEIKGKGIWKPYIKKCHFCEKVKLHQKDEGKKVSRIGIIEITPIVGVKKDELYDEKIIKYDIKIRKEVGSMDWGRNVYEVRCGDIVTGFSLYQHK